MSVTRTFTVTVVSTGGGNKYFIDGVQQATINIAENGTYKFDQSDSSNSSHPLRFATSEDAGGGSQYTTGVTANGTPGQAGAYTQIVVAESAPNLYYYCTNHSGMGGQANTVDDNTWGMWAWSTNEWGDQGPMDFTPTGVSATSSVGTVEASQIITVSLTAPSNTTSSVGSLTVAVLKEVALTAPSSATTSVGSIKAANFEGWGRQTWGNSAWGAEYAVDLTLTQPSGLTSSVGSVLARELKDVPLTAPSNQGATALGSITTTQLSIAALTAPSQMTSQLGDFDNAGTLVGWGRNGWGEEPYGDSFNKLVQPAGLSATSSVGSLVVADVVGITAPSAATASVGAISPADVVGITAPSAATTSIGGLQAGIGVLVTAPSAATSSVGSISPADVVGLTGVEATASVGSVDLTETQLIRIGFDGVTTPAILNSSVGSILLEIGVPLTGVLSTASVGSLTPEDVVGLTGVEATTEIGTTGFGTLAYKDIDITGNTSYTDVTHVA